MDRDRSFAETDPGVISEDEYHTSRGDQHRALYDFLKHISTLDSGALLIVAAFIEKIFKQPHYLSLAGIAVVCFLVSPAMAGVGYLLLVFHYPRVGAQRMARGDRKVYAWAMSLTLVGFVAGAATLAIFFGLNWFAL